VTRVSGEAGTVIEGTAGTLTVVATLRLFAEAIARYGSDFADVLPTCRVWVNGEEVPGSHPVGDDDEVAVLPPVSGGCHWGGSQ
jgi:molybdopterin converting factor small subunit